MTYLDYAMIIFIGVVVVVGVIGFIVANKE